MEIIRGQGRLTHPETREGLAKVSYVINNRPPTNMRLGEWSGNLVVRRKYNQSWDLFNELGNDMKLELDDGRSGKIIVTNWSPVPSDSPARFVGNGALE